ncbi:MAG TPA: cytochrome c oxidase accessory protein CcoG [Lacunisphaera sp.]|jgi:cytochrome c oxidase accessory protein FixG|nr:cytochrome c oxidase accessory protein CcoG [Lacunisphaera sp.]
MSETKNIYTFPSPDHPRPPAAGRHVPNLDSVTTINEDGSRYFLHPADVRGRFTRGRRLSAWALIVIYLVLPWVPVNGYPAVFLDVANRRFHLLGWTIAAQDMWLLFFLVTGVGFSLFFVTALLGRIWCGWACPQTVFLEHVYRAIERRLEGDAHDRRALDAAPWHRGKVLRRGLKHLLFAIVSLAITHLFLAYFVSIPELWGFMHDAPAEHWAAFLFVFSAAGVLYFNFAWFREQLCIVICPYGRLQSALTDDHTMVIGYDARRGEPRGKLHRETPVAALEGEARQRGAASAAALSPRSSAATEKLGDCIACNRCIQVCPTGIDIRLGLQLECIGCAACIDACDEVMTRVKRATGLIRYDSLAAFGGGVTHWVRPRTVVYGILLAVGAAVATFAFSTVKPASFSVVRMGGAAYFVDRDTVRDQFMVRVINKRNTAEQFTVAVEHLAPGVSAVGLDAPITVEPMGEQMHPLVLTASRARYAGPFEFRVRVRDASGRFDASREAKFLGPEARLLEQEDHEKGIVREHHQEEKQHERDHHP